MGQIANAHPQRGLIFRSAASVPRGPTELGEATGPQATDLKRPVKPGGQFSTACGPQAFFRKASRKLPRQGDSIKGELLASSWARYVAGGRPANASWGRSSL